MKTRTSAALLALLFASLPAPLARAQDSGAPSAPAAAEEDDAAALERMTGAMMKEVERLRGLKFKHDVKRVWKSRDEAKAEMLEEIDRQMPAEKIDAATKAMRFYGILKETQDLKEIFAEFISAGAAGYYIPEQKTFSLVRGFSEEESMPIIFHEHVHAVEDQYYGTTTSTSARSATPSRTWTIATPPCTRWWRDRRARSRTATWTTCRGAARRTRPRPWRG
jgi:hypothetical protein